MGEHYVDVTHVLCGFSKGLISDLDSLLPAASVLVVEDEYVSAARDVPRRIVNHPCVAGVVHAPVQNEQEPARVVRAVSRPRHIRAVVPATEYGVVAAAALADAWGLPGAGTPAAAILRDKAALRAHADSAGLPQPRWQPAEGVADVVAFRAAHGGRCVLKPADRQASLGVRLLDADDDAALAWVGTTTADEPRMRARDTGAGRFLVEERLCGPEVSVECLVDGGELLFLNITEKLLHPGPSPVELGHVVPASLPPEVTGELHRLMRLLVTSTGFGSGVLHAEWILVDGVRPHLVECAGRLPGDSIDLLIDLAYGGRIVADLLAVLAEGDPPTRGPALAGAAIRFLSAQPGVVRTVTGLTESRAAEGVREVDLAAEPGTVVKEVTSSWDRIGHLLATGTTGADAGRNAAAAAGLIEVRTS
ncbi:ATP-grasp domain-containing protein [Streptomyces fuscichromogenes]|uniref:ATP-grasp domain-containing protein n=1 Tax=Streptomyces fuscichromogenes TaxID=1324013 RepID=UPI0038286AEE